MLALRIIATVFLGISIFCGAIAKTFAASTEEREDVLSSIIIMVYGILWRTFVIVSIWLI